MQSGRHSSTLQRETQLLLDVARKDRRRYSETAVSVGEVAWNPKLMQNMLDNIILPNKESVSHMHGHWCLRLAKYFCMSYCRPN